MTKAELNAYIRVLADDAVAPYLCSDDSLNGFITEAEREAFERSLLGRLDSAYDITLVSGTRDYSLNSLVIFVRRAKIDGETDPLIKTTRRELDFNIQGWEDETGTPTYYYREGDKLGFYPLPDAAKTVMFDGFRWPESDMETPVELHESLAHWCLYRFYLIHDADTDNLQRAAFHRHEFDAVFGSKRVREFDEALRNNSAYSSMYVNPFS